MPRFMKPYNANEMDSVDNSGFVELSYLERAIDRRLAIFLVFCAVVIVGALGSGSSSLSAAGFSIGSFICWLLAISIILTTKKTGAVVKALKKEGENSFAKIEGKLYSKFIRWILGYIIPVFCAVVLTFGSVASSVGWLNDIWFYRFRTESKIDEIKNNLPEIKIEKNNNPAKSKQENKFQSIDSVIDPEIKTSDATRQQIPTAEENYKPIDNSVQSGKIKTPEVKREKPNNNFKPIDSLVK